MNNSSKITIYFFTLSLNYAIERGRYLSMYKRLENWWIEYLIILICFTSIRKQWNSTSYFKMWERTWSWLEQRSSSRLSGDEAEGRWKWLMKKGRGGGGGLELEANFRKVFTITEKAPTRAFFWLKGPINTFTFKNLWRHYAKEVLTHITHG